MTYVNFEFEDYFDFGILGERMTRVRGRMLDEPDAAPIALVDQVEMLGAGEGGEDDVDITHLILASTGKKLRLEMLERYLNR